MVNRLIEPGHLAYAPDRRIQPGKRFFERPIVDTIQAGLPQPANDASTDACSIDATNRHPIPNDHADRKRGLHD